MGSPLQSQIIPKNRLKGYRPEVGIWEVSQLTRKGLNYNEQENVKTELYFKRVISHHEVLIRKLLEMGGGGRAYSLSEGWCVSRRLLQGREQERKRIAVPVTWEGKEVTQREPEKGKDPRVQWEGACD